MESTFIEAIKYLFANEYRATLAAYKGKYDPFNGHREHDHKEGKSYFLENGYGDEEADAKIISTEEPDESTKLVTVGFEWRDPDEPFERPRVKSSDGIYHIGSFVVTRGDQFAPLKVRENHEELQFFGRKSDWWLDEEDAFTATVVLNKENGVWLLATAFPGPAGVHNNQDTMKSLKEKEKTWLDCGTALAAGADTSHVILLSDKEFDVL